MNIKSYEATLNSILADLETLSKSEIEGLDQLIIDSISHLIELSYVKLETAQSLIIDNKAIADQPLTNETKKKEQSHEF